SADLYTSTRSFGPRERKTPPVGARFSVTTKCTMTSTEKRETPGQFPGPIGDSYSLAATASTTWAAGAVTIHMTNSSVLPTTSAVRLPDSRAEEHTSEL